MFETQKSILFLQFLVCIYVCSGDFAVCIYDLLWVWPFFLFVRVILFSHQYSVQHWLIVSPLINAKNIPPLLIYCCFFCSISSMHSHETDASVLMNAHYDSPVNSPGAGDCGSCVGAFWVSSLLDFPFWTTKSLVLCVFHFCSITTWISKTSSGLWMDPSSTCNYSL